VVRLRMRGNACLRCEVCMAAGVNGRLAARGRVSMRRRGILRLYACSRACAVPDGMRLGASAPLLGQHAGVTGVQRPGRGGGAGPARGCGARSPATITHAQAVAAITTGIREDATAPMSGISPICGALPLTLPAGEPCRFPSTPPQPPLVPASGGNEVVGGSHGWGACLRCDVCMTAEAHGRMAARGRLHASAVDPSTVSLGPRTFGVNRKDVCADHGPLAGDRDACRSHPSPACVQGRTEHVGKFGA
jgi:hypothetical protein